MNRIKAIRMADAWRINHITQVAGSSILKEHESISAAKRFTRGKKCVALVRDDFHAGDVRFGFFTSDTSE